MFNAKPLQIGFVMLQSAYGFVACHKFILANPGASSTTFASIMSFQDSMPLRSYFSVLNVRAAKKARGDKSR
jgi:hypothetical protein